MIKWIIITGGVACLAATLLAQDANPPTFRAGADLIEISVTATHDGDPVLDLTKDDFRVRDKGDDQEIQFSLLHRQNPVTRHPKPQRREQASQASPARRQSCWIG